MRKGASLQSKFSVSYIAIILAVLLLMNTYPLVTSENLTFRSKQSSLQSSVAVMVTALSGLEELNEENVADAMTLVEETGVSRILVTDASGRVLYDTRESSRLMPTANTVTTDEIVSRFLCSDSSSAACSVSYS